MSLTLVEAIVNGYKAKAAKILEEKMTEILREKLLEAKKIVATKYGLQEYIELAEDFIDEGNIQRSGRLKIIRARIRGGKVQRRKKLSAVKGYTLRGGQLVRMSPMERRKRKLGARRAKIKRKRTLVRALLKRKRSMIKRKALGLR
jgi:hypothetical protein